MVWATSNEGSRENTGVFFTIKSATKMLPLLSRIVADMLRLDKSIRAQRNQLRDIDRLEATIDRKNYQEELSDIRSSLEDDQREFAACLSELATLGVSPHLPFDGSIDFPAELNRRHVRLCWQPGDEKVEYWHEPGEQPAARQRISS
jgi:hypothetical protein